MGAAAGNGGRNPNWCHDETVLLMDLYLSAPRAEKNHPEVVALSTVLRAAGRRDGRAVLASFRNPAGIAMRLRNFGRHDPAVPPEQNAGLRPGGAIDLRVWREFGHDREALASEVARIRRSISANDWLPDQRSSRGPVPAFGARTSVTVDGRNGVYLLLVDGPLEALTPGIKSNRGWAVVKVGRTSNIDRRMGELASSLPPRTAIRYVPVGLRMFGSAMDAHRCERRLLDFCDREGWSLGGEFAFAPLDPLKSALVAG